MTSVYTWTIVFCRSKDWYLYSLT